MCSHGGKPHPKSACLLQRSLARRPTLVPCRLRAHVIVFDELFTPLLHISTYVELFMARDRSLSLHAWTLLDFLAEMSGEWGYGYEIIRFSGLQSGTLYPLLIRLEAKGLLQAKWQPPIS